MGVPPPPKKAKTTHGSVAGRAEQEDIAKFDAVLNASSNTEAGAELHEQWDGKKQKRAEDTVCFTPFNYVLLTSPDFLGAFHALYLCCRLACVQGQYLITLAHERRRRGFSSQRSSRRSSLGRILRLSVQHLPST